MPELPEVENIRLGLLRAIRGQEIKRVLVYKPKLVSGKGNLRRSSRRKTVEFIAGLQGEKIINIERRAKNLIFRLSRGKILLVHLKMSGQLIYYGKKPVTPDPHARIVFELTRGVLFYNDQRMFGYVLYYPNAAVFEKESHFAKIGLEPFSPAFTRRYLALTLKQKSGRLKSVLMSQKVVAGLGNIYCDEVCFEAGIRPQRPANSLSRREIEKLFWAIKKILKNAIKFGGSSVDNYRRADGTKGGYVERHKVYGRGNEKCYVCGNTLEAIKINNRTTVFCGKCQK